MKILHVITGLSTGGAEMMLYKLLSKLNGKECHGVISLRDKGTIGLRIEALGIPVHTLNMPRGIPTLSGILRLRCFTRAYNPNIIQGWMYHGNLAASLASQFLRQNASVIWSVRQSLYSLDIERPLSRVVIRANAMWSRNVEKVTYNSKTSLRQHEAFGFCSEKSIFIPNGFDVEVFCPNADARQLVRKELGLSADTLLIGLVARYHPMKDHATFLRGAHQLLIKRRDVHFVLAGKLVDSQNAELMSLVHELNIVSHVHLLGERKDVVRLTAALDIASSSSSMVEAFSNAVGEAMACGVPCVVTDVGDSLEIIGDTGKVVQPKNPDALAKAWNSLLEIEGDARILLGMRARDRVVQNYSLDVVASQYCSLYEELSV